jgi:predicted metal-dependent HD superfamily phosphohydrolase
MDNTITTIPEFAKAEAFMLNMLEQQLSASLHYHGIHHTLDVMQAAMTIANDEVLTDTEMSLLRVAISFHDSGFLQTYSSHETMGCELAHTYLPDFGFSAAQIDTICAMIMATKIPQSPKTLLENIICDADLDYLGRADVLPIATTLFTELNLHRPPITEQTWNQIQIAFLQSHNYQTAYALQHRKANKEKYLAYLLEQ